MALDFTLHPAFIWKKEPQQSPANCGRKSMVHLRLVFEPWHTPLFRENGIIRAKARKFPKSRKPIAV